MTRRSAFRSVLAASGGGLCVRSTGDAAETAVTKIDSSFPIFGATIEDLKSAMILAVKWWTAQHEGRTYHICREELPFISVSRYNYHAWYQASADDQRLFHVWSCSTHGIGDIRLDIDDKAGMLTVVALERAMKNKVVSTFYLGAAAA